jgi:hypothetical protein
MANWFGDFVKSASGTTLITVLLGGVAAQLISCDAQRRAQQREFNNTWLKSRGDQALLARKEFVDGRRAALEEILRTAGTLSAASQDLIDITGPSFRMEGHTKADKDVLLAEQTRVTKEFTSAELAWAPAQPRFSFSVAYFGAGSGAVTASWQELRGSVNGLRRCASETYKRWFLAGQHIGSYVYDPAYCQREFSEVEVRAAKLGETFGVRSDQSGWDNPDSLKRKLNISN